MEVTQQQIDDLRSSFFDELQSKGDFEIHPNDLERIKTSDDWLRRFLLHHDLNKTAALTMMWETVRWRKEFGTNELNESNVRMDYLIDGGFFSHGRDKDGCALFIFKCKKHVKGARDMDELQRCLVYWFERLEREEQGKPLTLFFDMENCGLSNMDMEFTKYLIGLFKQYYPYFLSYILIFEMAWILSAAFKIIKSWLPEKAVQKIRFIKKADIKEYVPLDQALKCWGGTDEYVYSFVPEDLSSDSLNVTNSNKKVHFADGSQMSDTPGTVSDVEPDAGILAVHPSTIINFSQHGNELASNIHLHNTDSKANIYYKMKTTSPEKFRVRPSAGYLEPGAKTVITVSLQPGFQLGGLSRDKFLVLSIPVWSTDLSSQELADLWKSAAGKNIHEHRLKCAPPNEIKNGTAIAVSQSTDTSPSQTHEILGCVRKLQDSVHVLQQKVERLELYLWILIAFFVCMSAVVFVQLQTIRGELNGVLSSSESCCKDPEAL